MIFRQVLKTYKWTYFILCLYPVLVKSIYSKRLNSCFSLSRSFKLDKFESLDCFKHSLKSARNNWVELMLESPLSDIVVEIVEWLTDGLILDILSSKFWHEWEVKFTNELDFLNPCSELDKYVSTIFLLPTILGDRRKRNGLPNFDWIKSLTLSLTLNKSEYMDFSRSLSLSVPTLFFFYEIQF